MQFDLTTFVFELVNFVLLLWVLGRFVFRPIATSLVERREELASIRAAASEQLADAEARKAALDVRSLELDRLRESVFAEATAEAAAERERLLAQAREDASSERSKVQATLEAEREAALGWVRHEAIERGAEVAGMLLVELAPEAAHQALVRRVTEAVTERAEVLRRGVSDGVLRVEICWARPASTEDRAAVQEALAGLGCELQITERQDDELGAGVVVRVGDRVLDASVPGQVGLLREAARARLEGAHP